MRKNIRFTTPILLLALTAVAPAQDITRPEREQALRYLDQTRDGLLDAVKGLSEAQWKFKPGADRWSVAEVVEHLAVTEDLVHAILNDLEKAPSPAANRDVKQIDALMLSRVPDRSTKAQAPEVLTPKARWTPEVTLEHFLASRRQVSATLGSNTDLRGHVVAHPVFGPLDGYQWILLVAAHSERHTKQILEVKGDARFPRD